MKAWKWIKPVLIIVVAAGAVYGAVRVFGVVKESVNDTKINQNIVRVYNETHNVQGHGQAVTIQEEAVPAAGGETAAASPDQTSETVSGLLTVAGTAHRVAQGEENESGSDETALLDTRNSPGDTHIIIYGDVLDAFEDKAYYAGHDIIALDLFGEASHWRIFSVALAGEDTMRIAFNSEQDAAAYFFGMKLVSIYDTGVDVGGSDTVLTILPDSGGELALHAKQIE